MADDEAATDLTMDEKEDDDDDDDDDLEADDDSPKRRKSGGGQKIAHAHCDINFVKNTSYTLLAGDTKRQ